MHHGVARIMQPRLRVTHCVQGLQDGWTMSPLQCATTPHVKLLPSPQMYQLMLCAMCHVQPLHMSSCCRVLRCINSCCVKCVMCNQSTCQAVAESSHVSTHAVCNVLCATVAGWVDNEPSRVTGRLEVRPAAELGPIIVCLDTSGTPC